MSGASFLSDARTSVDGLHSLRLTSPADGESYAGGPYPVHFEAGVNYSVSVWAKASKSGVKLDLRPNNLKIDASRSTCGGASTCSLTTEWSRYEAVGTAIASTSTSPLSYTLATAGTAWLDMLDVKQVNDCPSDGKGHGFSAEEVPPFPGCAASFLLV